MILKHLRAVIIGAPGSGKGTISSRIVKYFGIKHISSGDLLRFNAVQHTDFGDKAEEFMKAGQLVPDDIVVNLVISELKKCADCDWLLDGFPRTRPQAEALHHQARINVAINLIVPTEIIVGRIAGRWIHVASGRVYNTDFNPPKRPGLDDLTGEPLVQRDDDKPEAVKKRLEIYSTTIQPILDFYAETGVLHNFTGTETDKIWPDIYTFLASQIKPKINFP